MPPLRRGLSLGGQAPQLGKGGIGVFAIGDGAGKGAVAVEQDAPKRSGPSCSRRPQIGTFFQ